MEGQERPLMHDAMAREFELAHGWRPMPPPTAGHYRVACVTEDALRGVTYRYERVCWFDGKGWPLAGGYCRYEFWKPLALPSD